MVVVAYGGSHLQEFSNKGFEWKTCGGLEKWLLNLGGGRLWDMVTYGGSDVSECWNITLDDIYLSQK